MQAAVASANYDCIAVELDTQRHRALTDPNAMAKLDLFQIIREGKIGLVAANLALAAYQRRLAEQLGLTIEHIGEEWRVISDEGNVATTQMFGRLAYEAGFEGLRFPSARRPEGVNLSLFPDNFHDGCHAVMLNSD